MVPTMLSPRFSPHPRNDLYAQLVPTILRAGNPSHIWRQPIHLLKMARSVALTLVLPHFDFQINKLHWFSFKAGQGLSLATTSYSILTTLQAILIVVFPYLPP